MIESPKEPPRGDFSTEVLQQHEQPLQQEQQAEDSASVIEEPIDVNIQGDTSKVFYDYNPEEANEIVVLETLTEESPKSEDLPVLPDIPVPPSSFDFPPEVMGTEQLQTIPRTTTTTTILAEGETKLDLTTSKTPPTSPTLTTTTTTVPITRPISKTTATTPTSSSSPSSSTTTSPASSPRSKDDEDLDEDQEVVVVSNDPNSKDHDRVR